ncbi:MAG: hypothetical protein ACLPZF_00420, partial [Candidatus Acidiferrales bacterium]
MSVLNGAMLTGAPEDGARKAAKNLAMLFGSIPAQVFWPYFAGASISMAGALAVKGELLLAKGTDKVLSMGRLFLAVPMAVFGAQHFTDAKFIVQLVPAWIPGAWFWTYFVGTALLAAALSIVAKKQSGLAASLLALMLFLFVVLMHIPNVVAKPSDRVLWAVALRDLSFSGGALALAGIQINEWKAKAKNALITTGRIFIAIATIFFGIEQLLHPDFVPGVPLEKPTPTWIPGHLLWAYLAGAVFLVAGPCILVNRKARLAATCVGVMVLLLELFVYLPMWGAKFSDIGGGLDYFVDTLAFAGAVLLL